MTDWFKDKGLASPLVIMGSAGTEPLRVVDERTMAYEGWVRSYCGTCEGARTAPPEMYGGPFPCPDCGRHINGEDWCFSCMRPEVLKPGGLCCGECFHVWGSPADLVSEHNEVIRQMAQDCLDGGEEITVLAYATKPEGVHVCPKCAHDL